MLLKDKAAIVGIGATPYYRHGQSAPQTLHELGGKAILAAVADAGLDISDVDGFAYYSGGLDTGLLVESLGIPELHFSAMITGGGQGSAASIGLAAMAVATGQARCVVCVHAMQQPADKRYGSVMARQAVLPENAFFAAAGLVGPGHMFALLARRHMHLYGTRREHFAEIAMSTRQNAITRPEARFRTPLTLDEYMSAPMMADPLCRFDFCLENDIAVASVVTSAERARDLRHKPVYVMATAHGGSRDWGRAMKWMGMPDEYFASAGGAPIAATLFEQAGITPNDIDVAELYDHFSAMVLMQLEDYGFCPRGESGRFVADGNIRLGGSIPINTHGGHLSEAYCVGATHIREAVEQLRGVATNQVPGAEIALVTGGPAPVPVSGLILRR